MATRAADTVLVQQQPVTRERGRGQEVKGGNGEWWRKEEHRGENRRGTKSCLQFGMKTKKSREKKGGVVKRGEEVEGDRKRREEKTKARKKDIRQKKRKRRKREEERRGEGR